jgi:hypothetical protein
MPGAQPVTKPQQIVFGKYRRPVAGPASAFPRTVARQQSIAAWAA